MTTKARTRNTDISILRNAMLFSLTRYAWRNRCMADQEKIQADCDKASLNTSKKLVKSDKLQALYQRLNHAYLWVQARSMQSSLRPGLCFVRRDMVGAVEAYMAETMKEIREDLLPAFLADYVRAKAEASRPAAEGGLGDLYSEADYPTVDELRERFGVEWCWMELSVPEELPEEVRVRECAKLKKAFADAEVEVKFALREGFKALVDNAANLLSGGRVFGTKTVASMDKFFDTFHARNLTDDAELSKLVATAKKVVRGLDLLAIKDEAAAPREAAEKAFTEVGKALEKLLQDRPKRKFKLEDAP